MKTPKFMLSGWSGKISESLDGITWVEKATIGYTVKASIYIKEWGLWIIGTSDGKIFTSPDLVSWTQRTSPLAGDIIMGFAYGNGMIVCISYGAIASSPDGINWTVRASGISTHQSICFAAGKFVIGGKGSTYTGHAYSTNGVSWNLGSSPTWSSEAMISYSPATGRFIEVTYNYNSHAYSYDGVTFTGFGQAFIYGQDKSFFKTLANYLMVVSASNGQIYTSYNGGVGDWTVRSIGPGASNIKNMEFRNGLYVAVGNDLNNYPLLYTSTDLVTWTARTPTGQGTSGINTVTFGGD
jgi:hypothetical protein